MCTKRDAGGIDPEPQKEVDLIAIFGPRQRFPRANAIARACSGSEGLWYDTQVFRHSATIRGALAGLHGPLTSPCRIVFPRVPGAMVAVVETCDHRIGMARSVPEGVIIAPPSGELNRRVRRMLDQDFGSFGSPS